MKIYHALLITLISIAVVAGCKKDDDDDTSAPGPIPTQNEPAFQGLFEDNIDDATQSFAVNAGAGGQVVATQGTRLTFDPGAFRHANGTVVTGQVEVKVVEVLGIGNMIWLNKQTVGNDNGTFKMLKSGGAINISATQGGNTLRIAEGGLVVEIPTSVGDPAMQLFSGAEDSNGNMVWTPIDSSSVSVDPGYTNLYYSFVADSLQWINCDYFYNYPSTTMLSATVPASSDSTIVWIAFPSENAVMNMYYTAAQTYTTWQVVPVGMQAVIVGLRRDTNGDYYSSFTSVTITNGMSVPITFSPTTLTQFQSDINAL